MWNPFLSKKQRMQEKERKQNMKAFYQESNSQQRIFNEYNLCMQRIMNAAEEGRDTIPLEEWLMSLKNPQFTPEQRALANDYIEKLVKTAEKLGFPMFNTYESEDV